MEFIDLEIIVFHGILDGRNYLSWQKLNTELLNQPQVVQQIYNEIYSFPDTDKNV